MMNKIYPISLDWVDSITVFVKVLYKYSIRDIATVSGDGISLLKRDCPIADLLSISVLKIVKCLKWRLVKNFTLTSSH